MKLTTLTEEQITSIYYARMVHDFPPAELKPTAWITDALHRGEYECLGAVENGELLGYAFLAKTGRISLLDYLAVAQEKRNAGIGASILALLRERPGNADCIVVETEDPDGAAGEEARLLQDRRLHFYLRNGYRDTGVRTSLYGICYRILVSDAGQIADRSTVMIGREDVRQMYRALYGRVIPGDLYDQYIIIR